MGDLDVQTSRPSFAAVWGLTAFLFGAMAIASSLVYRSVSVDTNGRLHIELASGRLVEPAMLKDQVGFGDPVIAPDRQTIGWLVLYPFPSSPDANYHAAPLAGALALYRAGHLIHTFRTDQVLFWDWQFQDGGKRIAYSTGPIHGGAAECVLRDVDSGQVVARWLVKEDEQAPAWARTLRR